jgi:hypothetical protein
MTAAGRSGLLCLRAQGRDLGAQPLQLRVTSRGVV